MSDAGRRQHYRRFFETDPVPGDELILVVGNCQAESVRLLLDPEGVRTVAVPPVFEMDADEVGLLQRLLPRVTALVTQPVRDDYRDLPLGSGQLAAQLGSGARVVTYPVVRYAGLHPFHVVVHTAPDPSPSGAPQPLPQPPLTPYHDLRVLAAAVGADPGSGEVVPEAVLEVGRRSLAELRRREADTDVTVSAALVQPGLEHMRTVNHPGNPVLLAVAAGVAEALNLEPPRDPGRALLNSLRAPVEPVVATAWGLTAPAGPPAWRIDGRAVPRAYVDALHRAWYAEHPDVAAAVWSGHLDTAALLGLHGPRPGRRTNG